MGRHPLDGHVVLKAGAFASVPLSRVDGLLFEAQAHIDRQRAAYGRRFERVEAAARHYYLAAPSLWAEIGDATGLTDREVDAVERAHEMQFERDGRRLDRTAEFAAALEIRSPVAVSPD